MELTRSLILAVTVLLLFVSVRPVASQIQAGISTPPAYQPGQVWTFDHDISVTILAVEDVRKFSRVVHVRIDNVPVQSCGDVHLTDLIEHVAVTEKMLLKSGLVFSKDDAALPQSSIDAYAEWKARKKHEIAQTSLRQILPARYPFWSSGPLICNFIPIQI